MLQAQPDQPMIKFPCTHARACIHTQRDICHNSVKLGLDASVAHAVDLELEAEPGTVDDHLEGEVEVVELDAARRREAREERARHGAEVRRQRAHVHEVAAVRRRRLVRVARDQVVRHHERLPRPEVARVVERDGREGGDGLALWWGGVSSVRFSILVMIYVGLASRGVRS